ncbi:MAG: hypothetical protein N2688_07695 [Burkholderiaceae bacterium]|nr:hypothetical protein [Burkholderiaceae bacterium]
MSPMPVRIDRDGERVTGCTLTTPKLPEQWPPAPARAALARMLGLAADARVSAAALAGWIAKRSATSEGTIRLTPRQGIEIGRPSELRLQIERTHGTTAVVRVGGPSVLAGQGVLLA